MMDLFFMFDLVICQWNKFDITQLTSVFHVRLTLKHDEVHGCVVSTVDTDGLVLKHQAISIHNAD